MTFYNQIESNIRKTWFFITLFLVLIIVLGWIFSNIFDSNWILIFAVAYSVIWSFLSYWYSDKIILSLNKAHSVSKNEGPELYRIVENLAITAGLPMPKIYIMEEESPNAFATGRNPQNSVICVTRGLLLILDKPELEGVIAHEFSHIGNRDILLSSVIVVLVGMISLLGNWFFRGMRFGVGG
ncbi:MAG: M48 family metalloprotease, partial [Candidatus Paceibacterota bacterium]